MATIVSPEQSVLDQFAIPPAEPIWRLSVNQYHAMMQAGILVDGDPVELLEGWLVAKMPKNPPHRVTTRLLRQALERLLPPGWYADSQEPITTLDSEPEPDITVVRGDTLDYLDRHPHSHEVGLVVEVADATLQRDQSTKKRLYGRANIAVYWVINLVKQQIEVYTQPVQTGKQPDYRQHQIYQLTDMIPVVLDEVEIGRIAVYKILAPKKTSL